MPIEMDEQIAEEAEKRDMTYSKYVRTALRNQIGTPFDPSDVDLVSDDSDVREAQKGGA